MQPHAQSKSGSILSQYDRNAAAYCGNSLFFHSRNISVLTIIMNAELAQMCQDQRGLANCDVELIQTREGEGEGWE